MGNRIALSVVVPVYNEEDSIKTFHKDISSVLKALKKKYEIIYIDDGSQDTSFELLTSLKQKDPSVTIVRFARNFGQHSAIMAGLLMSKGEFVITIDADMQNDPKDIPSIIKKLEEKYEVVCCYRETRKDSLYRRCLSKIVNRVVSKMTGVPLKDYGCMLRGYRHSVIEHLRKLSDRSIPPNLLITWLGVSIHEMSVSHHERMFGKSKYNLSKLFKIGFDIITSFSLFPVQFVTFTGIGITLFSIFLFPLFLYLALSAAENLLLYCLIWLLLFLSGLIISSIGLIGEYIVRIRLDIEKKPRYLIKDIIN